MPLGQRIDALDKLTGAAQYAADLTRPGMLHARVLRSPVPHARIVSINVDAARALPGVHAVLTGADIPADVRVGRAMRDMPVLARDRVRFIGEKVAAVAAETVEIADQALSLIDVEYEDLPAVFEPLEAIKPGAPLIHEPETVRAWAAPNQVVPDYPNGVSAPWYGASLEEVQQALASAHRVFEHTFRTPRQHQVYLEPHTCTVELDEQGVAHIWASNKAPILLATYLKEGLGLTRDRIAIHMLPLGGDFGGKGSFMDIPLVYFLARASGRAVKMTMSYVEELTAANPRHACTLVVTSGVDANNRLVARWLRAYFNSGAYAAFKPSPDATLPGFKRGAVGPYHVPVQRNECHMVYTNTLPAGHMRSPGEAQAAYALECHTDLLARELGMSAVEFRVLNGTHHARVNDQTGGVGSPPPIREVLERASAAIGLDRPRPPDVGRGVVLIEFSTTPGVYSGGMVVRRDGQIVIRTPIIEQGAGMLSAFRQIVAEEFGVPVEQVSIEQTIEEVEVDRGVGGSRVTRLVGKLLTELSRRSQRRLATLLGAEMGVAPEQVSFEPGGFRLPDGRFFTIAEVAALAEDDLKEFLKFEATKNDRGVVFMAQAAEVQVDRETGQVRPLKLVSVHEVGRIINPLMFQTQIEGAVAQGLGYALMESINVEEGRVTNVNLHEYKVPSIADLPPLEAILLPPDLTLGITSIGEGPNAGIPPAIVSAVADVVGPHPMDVPLSPEVVRRLAGKQQADGGLA